MVHFGLVLADEGHYLAVADVPFDRHYVGVGTFDQCAGGRAANVFAPCIRDVVAEHGHVIVIGVVAIAVVRLPTNDVVLF